MTKTPEELTEEWKAGKLDWNKFYYIKLTSGEICIDYAHGAYFIKGKPQEITMDYTTNNDVKQILAPVPTYNEYKAMQDQIVELTKKVKKLEEENVENLGYIGGLLNEGNEQVIKNRELRDLLRECKRHLYFQKKINNEIITLLVRINVALGESEA